MDIQYFFLYKAVMLERCMAYIGGEGRESFLPSRSADPLMLLAGDAYLKCTCLNHIHCAVGNRIDL